jgi:signal transduction histidine kinase
LAAIAAELPAVLGRDFWAAPWFAQTPGATDVIERAFRTALAGEIAKADLQLLLPTGSRHIDFALRPVSDEQGRITAVLAEGIDTTERRRNEDALRQAQKMEAVGQLTGGVAHDFNNLLTIIRSATDFLRRRDLPEERRRRYIDAISDTADRASKLTGQLLAFARRQPLSPVVFDVAAQVQSIANLIRPLVGGRIAIEVEVGPEPQYAVADVGQFETALVNLAVNGRDAMDGEGRLSITLRSVREIPPARSQPARAGEFVAISVTDSGSGIAPQNLDLIFEPFFTTKEVGRGTGLGLSQAFGFAKQSGGEIIVESMLGQGATFTIYLPRAQAPELLAAAKLSRSDPAGGLGHRILVVEDNAEVGKFSTELLQDLGYAIKWAKSADEALAALAEDEFAFDLVFSDVIMPGKNGVELAAIIRERYPGLPVVLTSGYSSVLAENAHQGFELVQKPYSVEAISRVLRRAISERRAAPAG